MVRETNRGDMLVYHFVLDIVNSCVLINVVTILTLFSICQKRTRDTWKSVCKLNRILNTIGDFSPF